MIRVVALTSGKNLPASRFRVRQFVEPLRRQGIHVRESHLPFSKYVTFPNRVAAWLLTAAKILGRLPGVAASRFADVTWFERELIPGRFTLERFVPPPSVLDVDDAIWLTGQSGYSERIASRCFGVIAGNSFIAEHYRSFARHVWIVPTSVDTDRWRPRAPRGGEEWTVGWIGTSGNLDYLAAIEQPLSDFLRRRSDARLLVVSDREPAFEKLPAGAWRFERWSEQREVELVASMDVGLMPLPDTEWARGKCSAKMLLYMASGLPVLVTPISSNAEILSLGKVGLGPRTPEEWSAGLEGFYSDRELAARCGTTGRRIVVESYSVKANSARIAQILRDVAGRSD